MPIFTLRRVLVVGGVTAAAGGAAFTYKQTLINHRKNELRREADRLAEECAVAKNEATLQLQQLAKETKEVQEFSNTVVTLWDDRQRRYREGIEDSYSYLVALPESLGILKGVSNHFRYATEELQRFGAYDITVSKVHNFGLLLSAMECFGVAKSCAALKELFTAEPLIHAVSSSVVALDDVSEVAAPASISEANRTYLFVVESLEKSIEEAGVRHHAEVQSNTPELSVVGQAVSDRLASLKVVANPLQLRAQKNQEDANNREKRLLRRLLTMEDVALAAKDAVVSVNRLSHPNLNEPLTSVDRYILADEKVKMCVKQLDLWRAAAERFLIEAQAASALKSYQTLLAHSLAQVHDVPSQNGSQ
jgi:hypothetical protein